MANTRAAIKKADLKRITDVMRDGGVAQWRVEVDPDSRKFTVIVGRTEDRIFDEDNDWDADG